MSTSFPTSLDSYGTKTSGQTVAESHINDIQDAVVALQTKVGINNSGVATTLDYYIKNFFASGRRVWVYADTAPTGWTVYSTAADCVIGVKGGSGVYNVTGGTGTLYGGWEVTGISSAVQNAPHTHVATAHTHSVPSHVHTMSSHTHQTPTLALARGDLQYGIMVAGAAYSLTTGGSVITVTGGEYNQGYQLYDYVVTGTTYAPNVANTSYSGTLTAGSDGAYATSTESASHNHNISQNSAWRAKAAVGIIIEKS